MKRILLTGATGFAGGHLAEALLTRSDVELFGLSRHGRWPEAWRHLAGRLSLRVVDLCDGPAVEAVLREVSPEHIYHLAGYAHPGRSCQEMDKAWAGNLTATLALYEATRRWGGRPRILYVGTGLIYGPATPDQACDEDCPLRPANPYAASKAAADLASYQYTRFTGLDVVRVRPFNHIGPRQAPAYAVAHFAQQIAAIEKGQRPPVLETGNLSSLRDLTDVRDMVQAYIRVMESGRTGEVYNAGTGRIHAMQAVLDQLLALSSVRIEVRQQARLMWSSETAAVRADPARLQRETGWAPRFSLPQTLADTLAYWRAATETLTKEGAAL